MSIDRNYIFDFLTREYGLDSLRYAFRDPDFF